MSLVRWSKVPSRYVLVVACVTLAGSEALGVGLYYARERSRLHNHMHDTAAAEHPNDGFLAFRAPGIDRPSLSKASEVELGDEELIIGISVAGNHRAYRLMGMVEPTDHIVNDVIDGQPVSVTYCNQQDCARAFTGGRAGLPLPLSQGGLGPDGMMICVGDSEYYQQSLNAARPGVTLAPFPFTPFPLERTTWKEWRARHPDTNVYTGPK